jgi:hypothetical protein
MTQMGLIFADQICVDPLNPRYLRSIFEKESLNPLTFHQYKPKRSLFQLLILLMPILVPFRFLF